MPRIVVLTDRFPERSETFIGAEVAALRRLGRDVVVEAVAPAEDPAPGGPDRRWTDDGTGARLRAVLRLFLRHPRGVLADLLARRRWRREEAVFPLRLLAPAALRWSSSSDVHVHVHFAAAAALSVMRIARITGVPWSVTAHAWEIYAHPANLAEKLGSAAFATSGCDYTVRDLQAIAPDADVHRVVMGVDARVFRRERPAPDARVVLAVGRLVEKKGFADLAAAASALRAAGRPVRVRIAGDGPLRSALASEDVELLGPVGHDGVRTLLQDADVLAMPCVVAADGDRDSMPVVVKEALAVEVPVIATDEVGLPEVVGPGWGRLVPPGDPAALAAALDEVLSLPVVERVALGRAGRAHVRRMADQDVEAARLAELIDASRDARRAGRPSPGSTAS